MENNEGYFPIAIRDDRSGRTAISFNSETQKFILAVSGKVLEPITLADIKVLRDNLVDVIEMKGRYMFIKDYDTLGDKT